MDNLIGKIVALKSGSTLMTVDAYDSLLNSEDKWETNPERVICKWFHETGHCMEGNFHVASLRISSEQ